MIILPSLLATLLILPTSNSKPLDFDKCKDDFTCACLNDVTKELATYVPQLKLNCGYGIQQRFINEQSALFLLVMPGTNLAAKNPLLLHQNGNEIFGCVFDINGNAELTGNDGLRRKYQIALFEKQSRCSRDSGLCLCAVKVSKMTQLENELNTGVLYKGIKQMKAMDIDYKFDTDKTNHKIFVKDPTSIKCDPYIFKEKKSLDGFRVEPVLYGTSLMDMDHLIADCKNDADNRKSYEMKYDLDDQIYKMNKLECRKEGGSYNYYVHTKETDKSGKPNKIDEENLDKYAFFCAANIAEVCEDPRKDCKTGPKCPIYNRGDLGVPAILKCPDNKWIVGGEYLVLEKDPICTADDDLNSNNGVFRIITPSGTEKKMDEATMRTTSCFQHFDCNVTNVIQLDETTESSNGVVKCKDDNKDMDVYIYEKNKTFTTKSFKCNNDTGSWINATSGSSEEIIPGGSFVTCPKDLKAILESSAQAGLSAGAQAGIILGALLITVALCTVGICAYSRYLNREYKPKEKKEYMKLSRDEMIKHCREFFAEALVCSPDSDFHIKAALAELDALFDVGIDDLDVFVVVYPFLMRIHGSIDRIDEGISRMFTRYLYLQAKKIIDKHGWISPTPIRKSNQNEGIIRVVAIQLLALAINMWKCPDAAKLALAGYCKLGFKGRQQYPHCGVMWSVIAHSRPHPYTKKDSKDRGFTSVKFENKLRKLLAQPKRSIPPEEIIPAFGNVQQQAAFALGAWTFQNSSAITDQKRDDGGKVVLCYLDGMVCSAHRTPAESLLQVTGMWNEYKKDNLEKLCATVSKEECSRIVEKAFKICVYYGRYLDAKKLDERFFPDSPRPNKAILQMQMEQEDFEEALEKQLEEVREWYGAHTDLEELKKKPVYTTSETYMQEHRFQKKQPLPEPAAQANPNPAAKSNTGSAKSSTSGTTTEKDKPPSENAAKPEAGGPATPAAAAPAQAAAAAPPPPSA